MANKKPTSEKLCLPVEDWPAGDRQAWAAAQVVGDIFGTTGRAAHWAEASKEGLVGRYGRWLAWSLRAHPPSWAMTPGDRVTRERVQEYVQLLKASIRSEVSVRAYVRSLLTAMLMFAPDADWKWLRIVDTNLRKTMKPAVDKRHQVRPVRDLFAYGIRLMKDAESIEGLYPIDRAVLFRDGLLITIFASRAPRRGTVTLMEIGKHLVREGDLYWLAFGEHDMKGGRYSEKYLPRILSSHVTHYLEHHRLVLLRSPDREPATQAVWIGEHGRPIKGPGIYNAVCIRTLAGFDVRIPPHRFRNCLATSFAYEDPENLPAATSVLDHATPTMVNQHYNQSQARVSLRRVHSNLDDLREQLRPVYDRMRYSEENDDGI